MHYNQINPITFVRTIPQNNLKMIFAHFSAVNICYKSYVIFFVRLSLLLLFAF